LRVFVVIAMVALAACGLGPLTGDEVGGGADNLPTRGAGPFRVPGPDFDTPADEPYILAGAILSLTEPTALARGGGGFIVWFGQLEGMTGSQIWRAEFSSTSELVEGPAELVLQADAAWEEGFVGAPSVILDGDEITLYYRGGIAAPAIGIARSYDDGKTFEKDANNPILVDATEPSAARAGDLVWLASARLDRSAIDLRSSEDGVNFDEPRVVTSARTSDPEAFDHLAVTSPELAISKTVTGDFHYGIFVEGRAPGQDEGEEFATIGYLGTYDLQTWERFLEGQPVLNAGLQGAGGPAWLRLGAKVLLLFHQFRGGRGRLAAGLHP
jgi:hypothetical protein